MRTLLLLPFFLLFSLFCKAALPDGAPAPTWTLADFQTSVQYSLQDYIDQGIPVILDFSATWCPPCWSYHQTHVLADIYDEYGPTGTTQVDGAMVFFMEGDYGTNDACLLGDNAGCSGSTMGDWTNGTPYPIFNIPSSTGITAAYNITYWPTLYAVSPQGTVYEVGQASKSTWESWLFETFALAIDNSIVSDVLCPEDGGSIDLAVSGGSGNLSYAWSNGANTQDVDGLAPGQYTVVITEGRGYSIEKTFTVSAGADPLEVSLAGEDVLCNAQANGFIDATLTGGTAPYTYEWSNGETTPTISNLSGGVYTVEILDANDCYITSAYEVFEPEVLEQTATQFPTYCGLNNGQIVINASGGVEPYLYTVGDVSSTSHVFSNLEPGGYVSSIEDANGCSVLFSVFVEEIEEPVAMAVADEQPTCVSPQVTLSGEGSTSSGNISYNWYSDDGGTIVSGQGTLYPTVEGNGTYNLIVTDMNYNCTDVASVVIEGNTEVPTADAGEAQVITCDVLEVILDGSSSSSGSNFSYEWSTPDGNIIDGENTSQATVNAAGEYQLLVTNLDNGCSASSTVMVDQTAELPNADAGESQSLTCSINTIILDGSSSDQGDDIVYTWTTDNGSIVSGENTLNPEVDAAGTYLLEVYNTVSGCVSFATVLVDENTTPSSAEISEVDVLTCVLEEQVLMVTVEADDVIYSWSTSDGNILEGSDTNMPTIDEPGTYVVDYTDLATGCTASQSVMVEEFINDPQALFSVVAMQPEYTFVNESTGNPTSFSWDFGDGNFSSEENPSHVYLENGTYEVCLTITNECGESNTCSEVTILIGEPVTFSSSVESPTCSESCDGTIEIFPDGGIDQISLSVSGPNGFFEVDEYELNDLCAGLYIIDVSNEIGDMYTETIEIIAPEAITIDESEVVHVDCAGNQNGQISLTISGGTGMLTAMWDNELEGTTIDNLGGGDYQVSIEDEQGCTHIVSFTVNEPLEVDVDLINLVNIDDNNPTGSIDIDVTGGVAPYEFLWSHGEQTEDVSDLDFGEYTVIVTDFNGCQDTYGPYEIQNLVGVEDIEILNNMTISPNPTNGQINLELEFSTYTTADISILNYLGKVIVSEEISSSYVNKVYDLQDLPAGIYIFKLQVGDGIVLKKIVKQ